VVMGVPEFVVYRMVALLFGARPVEVPLVNFRNDLRALARAVTPRTKLVVVSSPNNPTGTACGAEELLGFVRSLPEALVCVVDEAYADFAERAPDLRPLIAEGRNVIALRTFSKVYGLASLRVGYGYSTAELASLVDRVRQPFNVSSLAQVAALAALDDDEHVARTRQCNHDGMAYLRRECERLGLTYVPSWANFLLVRVGNGARVYEALLRDGVIVRPVSVYGFPDHVRITVGTAEENARCVTALERALRGGGASAAAF